MSNPNPQRDQQSTSARGASPRKQQQQQQQASPEKSLLVEPLTSPTTSEPPPSLLSHNNPPLGSSPLLALHNKENTQVQPPASQSLKSGDKKQQLSSLVRNASNDLLGTSVPSSLEHHQQQQQQQALLRKSRLEAEFADDSIRSLTSANTTTTTTSNTIKSPPSPDNRHRLNRIQHQQTTTSTVGRAINDSGIEASASHSEEARRLLGGESCSYSDCVCCTGGGGGGGGEGGLEGGREEAGAGCPGAGNRNSYRRRTSTQTVENMSLASQTIKLVPAYFVSELIGTFLLIVIGDGSVAAYVLTKRPVDLFCACFAFGVGAMIASFVGGKISGAHLNPAATLAFALDNRLKWELVPVYMIAQYVGGFLAALVLFLNYSEGINALDGGVHTALGANSSTGGIFATYPAPYVTVWGSLLDQIVGTAVLLFSLTAVGDKNNLGLEDRFQPPIVALVVGLVCLAFNPNCGAIFNPARDLSPRLLTAIFGYEGVWAPIDGTYWILAGVVGPHIGAIIGVFAYRYLIGASLEAHKRHMQMIQNSVVIGCGTTGESFDEKKAPRLQSFQHHHSGGAGSTHKMTTNTTTTMTPVGQRRQELSDYGSAVMR